MPSKVAPDIHANKDGTLTIQYQPKEKGVHEVNLVYNEQQPDGLPFRCHVDAFDKDFVTAYGEGLNSATGGDKAVFYVAGGNIDVSVEGPQKIDVEKKAQGGVTECGYTPLTPGEYKVHIKHKGKPIHGSPFTVKVSGEGRKRSQVSLAGSSDYSLGGKGVDLTGLEGTLKTPGGGCEPILLKKCSDGSLGISSFAPMKSGTYTVEVNQDGKKYAGSPFSIKVGDREVCSAPKVKVSGATSSAEANKWNNIVIDISNAGHGNISYSIEGSNRNDLETKDLGGQQYQISFKPHEPGIYLMNINFGHTHVSGSPFMVNVTGQPSGRVRETVSKEIGEAKPSTIGTKCEFQLKIPGTDPLDMEAMLTFPSGKSDLCEIKDMPHSLYDIRFTPEEEGVHTVSLKHKGLHIAGSPFQYTVGKIPCGGTHKVEIGGPGLERGECGSKNQFNVYTREAGAGTLCISVEGPSKAQMEVIDRGSGYTTVSYAVTQAGDYGIHVKYNGEHVPDSPSFVYIAPESGDAKMCTVHGIRDRGLTIDKPVSFTMSMNGAKGEPRAYVETPASTEEDVFIQELDKETYALRFMPKENGVYYVNVKLHEAHIPGSPFPMVVGKLGADPALVLAHGDGLEKGEAGRAAKFFVTTTNAGAGTLGVIIDGPSKCAIVCSEQDEGYEFVYTPMAPGDYLVNIKYCNITIAGCPTKAVITGKGQASDVTETSGLAVETVEKKPGAKKQKKFTGDASKVSAKGTGLKKAFMNRPAQFNLDVKDAGNALLTVAMISSNGRPAGELTYKKQRATVYQVTFKAEEKGEHHLFVRWGTDDIPGSPFPIDIV